LGYDWIDGQYFSSSLILFLQYPPQDPHSGTIP